MSNEFSGYSATALMDGYARRKFSPVEVLQNALKIIEERQPFLNAFCLVDPEVGLDMARQSEQRWMKGAPQGLLDGIPVPIKDTSVVRGWPARFGSLTQKNATPAAEDQPMVARLRESGAVFFCKTTAPEFAWKGITDNRLTGITRNPWDVSKTPGGSSGGSAVAVAIDVAPIATGADGAGSIRIPASFTGIYGIKPTAGLVPSYPSPLGSMAVVGPLSRSVEDAALMLQVISQPDPRDSFAAPFQRHAYPLALDGNIKGLRIGLSLDLGFDCTSSEVAAAILEAATAFRALGATVEPVTLDLSDAKEAFETLWAVGFTEILGRLPEVDLPMIEPALKRQIDVARNLTGMDVQRARRMCRVLSARVQSVFEEYDLLLTPTLPITAFEAGQLTPDHDQFPNWWDWTPYTWPINLTRNPAASCPCGFSKSGLPIGLQLVGRWFDETTVLRASYAFEKSRF
ncbi:amidase [Alcaligenaceae bacterium]|nr:amidase [Alcaligenaceae bacterium]